MVEPVSRASEGVSIRRHPRTDFPQFGWLQQAGSGTLFEARTQTSWDTRLRQERMRRRSQTPRRTDFPLPGWLFAGSPPPDPEPPVVVPPVVVPPVVVGDVITLAPLCQPSIRRGIGHTVDCEEFF